MLNDILSTYTSITTDKGSPCQETQYLGIDNGSTGTRSFILLDAPTPEHTVETISFEQLELDHKYVEVDIDDVDLLPVTANDVLEDKLELLIENYNIDGYIDYMHIIRGKMAVNSGKQSPRLITSLSKVYQRQTYVNILSSIAISLMSKAAMTGVPFGQDINIDLSATLPPEDLIVEKTVKTFKERLVGQYNVRFPQMDYEVRFNISEENIHVCSEPYAIGKAFLCKVLKEKDKEFYKGVVCDIGGRSTDCILITNGRVNKKFQTTFTFCGQDLIKKLTILINRTLNIPISERDVPPEVLTSGVLHYNATSYDVVKLINRAKASFVNDIVQTYLSFLDESNEAVVGINDLILTGRVFTEIERDGEIASPSMVYKLRREVTDLSPNTRVEVSSIEYPILIGLMSERLENI